MSENDDEKRRKQIAIGIGLCLICLPFGILYLLVIASK